MNFEAPRNPQDIVPETRDVKKLADGSILLPYDTGSAKYDFKISKKGSDGGYSISVGETTERGYKQALHNVDQQYPLDLSSKENFRKSLGTALGKYIHTARIQIENKKKWDDLYALLVPAKVRAEEENKQKEKNKELSIAQEVKNLQEALLQDFHWSEKTKTLTYDYTLITNIVKDGKEDKKDRTIRVSLQQQGEKTLVTLQPFNTWKFWEKIEKGTQILVKDKKNIPAIIHKHLTEGIKLREEVIKVSGEEWLKNADKKANSAIIAYEYYANQVK